MHRAQTQPFLCPTANTSLSETRRCSDCLQELQLPTADYAVGKTLVLLKRHVLDAADTHRAKLLYSRALAIQLSCRRLHARAVMKLKRTLRAEWLRAEEVKRKEAAARAAFLRSSLVLQASARRALQQQHQLASTQRRGRVKTIAKSSRSIAKTKEALDLAVRQGVFFYGLYIGLYI